MLLDYGKRFLKYFQKKDLLVIAALLAVMVLLKITVYADIPAFQERWIPCLKYLGEGVLYQGQPRCVQGPVFFGFTFLLWKILGSGFEVAILAVNILVHLLIFSVILFLCRYHKVQVSPWILAVLYIFFMFIPASNHSDALYASLFFLLGFIALWYVQERKGLMLAGFLFGISLLIKAVALIPMLVVILAFLFREFRFRDWRIFVKKVLFPRALSLFYLTGLLFGVILLFELLFPGTILYNFVVLQLHERGSFFEGILEFLKFLVTPVTNPLINDFSPGVIGALASIDAAWLVMAGSILLGILVWWRKKDAISGIFLFSMLLMGFLNIKFGGGELTRHLLPVLPFFIFLSNQAFSAVHARNTRWQKLGCFFLLLLLIVLGFAFFHLAPRENVQESQQLKDQVNDFLTLIPWEQYRVLTDTNLSSLHSEIFPRVQDILPEPLPLEYRLDSTQARRLEHLGILQGDWVRWRGLGYRNAADFAENLLEGAYDVMYVNPIQGNSPVAVLTTVFEDELLKLNVSSLHQAQFTCQISPVLIVELCPTCNRQPTLFLKDEALCAALISQLEDYYKLHFERFCSADYTHGVFLANPGGPLSEFACHSQKSVLMRYYVKGLIVTLFELFIFLLLVGVIAFYSFGRNHA